MAKNKGDDGRKKYFIVIGKDQEGNAIGFVLINSEVNPHLPACRKELHYLLKATDYDFLEGEDRFVDCSDFKKISKERFADLFSAEKQKGKINQQDVKKIKDLICSYENVLMKIPLFVLNGYSARDSGYRAATNINYLWNTKNLHS